MFSLTFFLANTVHIRAHSLLGVCSLRTASAKISEISAARGLHQPALAGTRCSVVQCAAVCCSVLQCVALCCSMLQCGVSPLAGTRCSVVQCAAVCCSVLQFVAVCCRVLQCGVAVCCSVFPQQGARVGFVGRYVL